MCPWGGSPWDSDLSCHPWWVGKKQPPRMHLTAAPPFPIPTGLLVQDVMHLHDGSPPVPITFGCETRETGEIYWQTADGLLGMGRSPASVLNQLVAADQVANTFSLCLGSVRGDGALILGDAGIPAGVDMQVGRRQ